MKTEHDINDEILKTTMKIHDKFPELSKYLNEMPVTVPDVAEPTITAENLEAYNESLNILVRKYSKSSEVKL